MEKGQGLGAQAAMSQLHPKSGRPSQGPFQGFRVHFRQPLEGGDILHKNYCFGSVPVPHE